MEQQAKLLAKRRILQLQRKYKQWKKATVQTQKGQKEKGNQNQHYQMLVLQQDSTHASRVQIKKIPKQTSDMEKQGNQIKVQQQQNLCIE